MIENLCVDKPWLMLGDCLDRMREIPDGAVDMVLCDLPYGVTACAWDTVIPLDPLWDHYRRIVKRNGAIVLTSAMPFTAALVMSNPKIFRYSLVWDKVNKYTGALNSNRMPMRRHEDICVFYRALPTFNKQYRVGRPFVTTQTRGHGGHTQFGNPGAAHVTVNDGRHNPCSIIAIPADNKRELGLHPTQKVVALCENLIRTYSNEGDIILDNASGSFSTAIACLNTGRRFIGIERDARYFDVGRSRIDAAIAAIAPDPRYGLLDAQVAAE